MAKPGPKPSPAAVHIAKGTYRADRHGEVKATIKLPSPPKPPKSLGTEGKAKWKELVEWFTDLEILEPRFLDAMELYCRAWDRLREYEDDCKKGRRYFTTDGGYVSVHPAVTLAKQARDEIRWYQEQFGFTPSSASRVNATGKKGKSGGVSTRRRALS